ncbi:MAG: hypothetical protein UW06_C0035G0012, partial [Parcubacteria group bacterium GW2011_GWE1_43_8]
VDLPFNEAVERTKAALAQEGFGILTEIDVTATLKQKMGVDYDDYVILGACNPPLAYKALQANRAVGLFMPCNVIVYKDNGKILVSAMRPTVALGVVGDTTLLEIAQAAEEKFIKIIANI